MDSKSIIHSLLSNEPTLCEDYAAEMVVLGLATSFPARLRGVIQDLAQRGTSIGRVAGAAARASLEDMPDDILVTGVGIAATGCEMAFPLNGGTTLHVRYDGHDMYAWVS
ncbi:MAG: hypothetical protein ACRC4O_06510 [Giesbergeria sp.]